MEPQTAIAAVLPYGTLSYIATTGSVLNPDVVDVWVRLTMDPDSPPLAFSSNPLSRIDPSLIPASGYHYLPNGDPRELRPFASVFAADPNVYAGCSGGFIGDCSPGSSNYTFNFNFGANSVISQNFASVAPGDTLDYMLGGFTPMAWGGGRSRHLQFDQHRTGAQGCWPGRSQQRDLRRRNHNGQGL